MSRRITVNIQGLSRRSPGLMKTIEAKKGYTFVSIDMCFPTNDTEFLTETGWKKEPEIAEGEKIWQVDKDSLKGSWVVPKRRISYQYSGDMVSYSTVRGSLTVTKGHKMLWVGQVNHPTRRDKALWRNVTLAGEGGLKSIQHICHFSYNDTISSYSGEEIWIACLLQADGSLRDTKGTYVVEVSKPRKRNEITKLLGPGKCADKIRPKQTMLNERWTTKFNSPLLEGKKFNLSTLGQNQADTFVAALAFWDGCKSTNSKRTERVNYCTTEKHNAEEVQKFLTKSGYECNISHGKQNNPKWKDFYKLSIRKNGVTRWTTYDHVAPSGKVAISKETITKVEDFSVSCFEVDSGFLMVRQGGQTFVSGNCSGEPTVTSHYSHDHLYNMASFGMIGKTPFFDKSGILMIDDIYIMTASKAPMFKHIVKDFYDSKYLLTEKGWIKGKDEGLSFPDAWLKDKEGIQGLMKKPFRQASKANCLGISYSMGPKKMVTNAYQQGFDLDIDGAREFYKTYWEMYHGVRSLERRLQAEFKKRGFLVNAFGYRIIPDSNHKVLNYFIQSSVSGIMHVLSAKYKALYPKAHFVATIHDENIYEVPENEVETAKALFFKAVDSLNADLKWSVPMRCGWVTGRDLYEAK